MNLVRNVQPKNAASVHISELLIELRGRFGLKVGAIANRVGVSPSFVSGVGKGKRKGGRQLLAGLLLLREVMILKAQPAPKSTEEQIAELRAQVIALQKASGKTVYPEISGQHYLLNEPDPQKLRRKKKGGPPPAPPGDESTPS